MYARFPPYPSFSVNVRGMTRPTLSLIVIITKELTGVARGYFQVTLLRKGN